MPAYKYPSDCGEGEEIRFYQKFWVRPPPSRGLSKSFAHLPLFL
jgi:hypothetical protein